MPLQRTVKEWTFASAFKEAFHSGEPMMSVYYRIKALTEDEKAQAEAMLRELGYDF